MRVTLPSLAARRTAILANVQRRSRVRAATHRPLMFHELAEYYDSLLAEKDYRSESERLNALARRYGRTANRSWLDVACGTGRHLEFLRRTHRVAGVDVSPEMLRVARRRLPGVRFVRGDMRRFRLHESFDVVSCLFSAVGHLRTEDDLRRTFVNFARHLNPGGVAMVEPWIDPAELRPGMIHLMTHEGPEGVVVRLGHSSGRGNRSVIRCHYLIGQPHRGVRHLEEIDLGLMVPRRRILAMMSAAGLEPHYLARGVRAGRGLFVGVKNRRSAASHAPSVLPRKRAR